MSNNQTVTFKKGKISREELELPRLHFVVVDQWLDLIGEKAFLSWLKFYSWADRSHENVDNNLWEQAKIPTSINKIIKKLGVGRDTFYNKILKPLWNVGLIDIEEYKDSVNQGLKPINIIVYKYPQNDVSLATKKLEIIRNYDSEYHSEAKTFAYKGGRPKNSEKDSSEMELGGSSEIELGEFSNRTRGSSEMEHNNTLNSINQSFNSINHNFKKNLSNLIENTNLEIATKKMLLKDEMIDRLILLSNKFDISSEINDLEHLFAEMKNLLPVEQFNSILSDCLKKAENIKKGIKVYLRSSIKQYMENMKKIKEDPKQAKKKEVLPNWFDKNNNENKKPKPSKKPIFLTELKSLLEKYQNNPDSLTQEETIILMENKQTILEIYDVEVG